MNTVDRITFDPEVMGGKPCIRRFGCIGAESAENAEAVAPDE
jgi:hypothetical protein